ncbi:MAG TPA: carboxylesterase, partial [Pusillimonas sp.]
LPLASTVAAERHAANQDTPIFLAHGTMDPVVVLPRAEASQQVLRDLGYQVNWKTYLMQHSVCQEEITDASAFLNKVLV